MGFGGFLFRSKKKKKTGAMIRLGKPMAVARVAATTPSSSQRVWHVIDAQNHVVGRLAAQISRILQVFGGFLGVFGLFPDHLFLTFIIFFLFFFFSFFFFFLFFSFFFL